MDDENSVVLSKIATKFVEELESVNVFRIYFLGDDKEEDSTKILIPFDILTELVRIFDRNFTNYYDEDGKESKKLVFENAVFERVPLKLKLVMPSPYTEVDLKDLLTTVKLGSYADSFVRELKELTKRRAEQDIKYLR